MLHVQLDAIVTYKKERNNEFYTAILSVIKAENKNGEVILNRELFAVDDNNLNNLQSKVLSKWEECFCELQVNYPNMKFGTAQTRKHSYRKTKVLTHILTFNLI